MLSRDTVWCESVSAPILDNKIRICWAFSHCDITNKEVADEVTILIGSAFKLTIGKM